MVLAAVLALTLYLPLMAGQLSVASPGFYALGGYIAAILSTKVFAPAAGLYPVSLVVLEMAVAAVASGVLGLAVGVPTLRLRGIFLALATIAFVQILGVVALNLDVTGGAIGIFGIPQPFSSQLQYMWLAIPLLLLSMLFVARLERTRTGRALIALREDELAAAAMGVDPTYHKVLAFTASAVLAVADVGGLPPWFAQFLRDGRLIIFGVLIALGTVFFPHGLITPGLLGRLGLGRRTGKA